MTRAQRAAKHGKSVAKHGKASESTTPGASRTSGLQARLYPGTAPSSASESQGQHSANLLVIAGVVAVAFLFWYFHLLTLNQMTQLTGGLAMPDSLIGGYDAAYIEALRNAMGDDARGQLSYLHKTAGALFPVFFALVWLLLIGTNTRRRGLRWLLWTPPLLFAVVDIWENIAIDSILGAASLDEGAVVLASALTVARWVLLALSLVCAVVALWSGRAGWRRRRN